MVDYSSRIASLKFEQSRLAQRQVELAEQRRKEIGKLADRIRVLEAEDDVFAGLFLQLKAAMESDGSRLSQWRDAGTRFRSAKRERSQRHGANVASHASSTGKAASE